MEGCSFWPDEESHLEADRENKSESVVSSQPAGSGKNKKTEISSQSAKHGPPSPEAYLKISGKDSYFTAMEMATKMTEFEFRAFVITNMATIRTLCNKSIQHRSSQSAAGKAASFSEQQLEEPVQSEHPLLNLPAMSLVEWERFDEQLKDKAYEKTVGQALLTRCSGDDVGSFTRSVLSAVMSNHVGGKFSYYGAKGKLNFTTTKFQSLLLRVVHTKKAFKKVPVNKIITAAGRWLTLSDQRGGKRKSRSKQVTELARRSPRLAARQENCGAESASKTKAIRVRRDLFREEERPSVHLNVHTKSTTSSKSQSSQNQRGPLKLKTPLKKIENQKINKRSPAATEESLLRSPALSYISSPFSKKPQRSPAATEEGLLQSPASLHTSSPPSKKRRRSSSSSSVILHDGSSVSGDGYSNDEASGDESEFNN